MLKDSSLLTVLTTVIIAKLIARLNFKLEGLRIYLADDHLSKLWWEAVESSVLTGCSLGAQATQECYSVSELVPHSPVLRQKIGKACENNDGIVNKLFFIWEHLQSLYTFCVLPPPPLLYHCYIRCPLISCKWCFKY